MAAHNFSASVGAAVVGLPLWAEIPLAYRFVAGLGATLAAGVNVLSATSVCVLGCCQHASM
jgi:hypothetical protein